MSIFCPNIKVLRKRKDIEGLIKFFTHQDVKLRQKSSDALSHIGHSSVPYMLAIITDSMRHPYEIEMAINTLVKIGPVCIPDLLNIIVSKRNTGKSGSNVIKVLEALEWEPESKAEKIQYLKIKRNWKELVKIADNPEDEILEFLYSSISENNTPIIKLAGEIGSSKSVDKLAKIVSNCHNVMRDRLVAINSLTKINTEISLNSLVELLHNELDIIKSLNKQIKDEQKSHVPLDLKKHIISKIHTSIENEENMIKAIAITMIQNGEESIGALVKSTTERSNSKVKDLVLQMIKKEDVKPEYLSKLLLQGSKYKWILPGISKTPIDKKEKVHYLLYKNDIKSLVKIKDVFEILASMFSNEEFKYSIIEILGELKDTRAIELLQLELKKKNTDAVMSLAKIGGLEATEAILRYIYNNMWVPIGSDKKLFKAIFKDYTDLIFISVSYNANVRLDIPEEETYDNVNYYLVPAEEGVENLCKINTPLSSNLLHFIISIPDLAVGRGIVTSRTGEWSTNGILSFQTLRELAQKELIKRGNPDYDSNFFSEKNAWTLK